MTAKALVVTVTKPGPGLIGLAFPEKLTDREELECPSIGYLPPFTADPKTDCDFLEELVRALRTLPSVGLVVSGKDMVTYRAVGTMPAGIDTPPATTGRQILMTVRDTLRARGRGVRFVHRQTRTVIDPTTSTVDDLPSQRQHATH